jgi:hypothetical protein
MHFERAGEHNTGFSHEGAQQCDPALLTQIEAPGATVPTGSTVLRSLGTAIRDIQTDSQQDLVARRSA